jgi:hypothetical protein
MNATTLIRRLLIAASLALTTPLVACDAADDPVAPDRAAAAVVAGQILPGGAAPAAALAGVRVELEGSQAFDVTDGGGRFRLEGPPLAGRLVLRFRRGTLDVRLELEEIGPGTVVRLEVELGEAGASVHRSSRGDGREFEGIATLVSVGGSPPSRALRITVADVAGARPVEIVEGVTTVAADGDLTTFMAVLGALEAGTRVRVEGRGSVRADGTLGATTLEAEVDEDGGNGDDDGDDNSGPGNGDDDDDDNSGPGNGDDDGDDDNSGPGNGDDDDDNSGSGNGGDDDDGPGLPEFEGVPSLVALAGAAPGRVLRVSVADTQGPIVVDIVEDGTTIDPEGDLLTFDAIVGALTSGRAMKLEGEGTRAGDGSLRAVVVKAETDED